MERNIANRIAAIIGLMVVAPAAQARGIDCTKATTKLDKIICADPQMRDYDTRIAAAYSNAMTVWKGAIAAYVRRDQINWLRAFRTIGTSAEDTGGCALADTACIRQEMLSRVEAIESGAYIHSGAYLLSDGRKLLLSPRRANNYALRIFKPSELPTINIASLDEDRAALWDGTDFMVAKMGDGNGLPLPNPQEGPDPDGCTLRLAPEPLSIRIWQMGYCGGRNYAGVYKRDLSQILADYELELF